MKDGGHKFEKENYIILILLGKWKGVDGIIVNVKNGHVKPNNSLRSFMGNTTVQAGDGWHITQHSYAAAVNGALTVTPTA